MHVHVVNLSTLVSDEQARHMVKAVNEQVRGEFSRSWSRARDAVHFSSSKQLEGCAEAVIAIVNAPPVGEEGVLGQHMDLGEQVRGYVYVAPVLDSGGGVFGVDGGPKGCCVSGVLSHEVLELIINPSINRWADDELGDAVAMEICDPCEALLYSIDIPDGPTVFVSDYVLPAYFDPTNDGPFDYLEQIKVSFGLAEDGYQIIRDAHTSKRSVWGACADWRKHGKACALSRTSRALQRSRAELALHAVSAIASEFVAEVGRELVESLPNLPIAGPRIAPPPIVPTPKKRTSRVIVGPGGRPTLKEKRRVKQGR